jgi:hypothetical protein
MKPPHRPLVLFALLNLVNGTSNAQIDASASLGSNTTWDDLSWTPSTPGVTAEGGDIARLTTSNGASLTNNSSDITLGRLSLITGGAHNITISGNKTITFKSGSANPASPGMTRSGTSSDSLSLQLNTYHFPALRANLRCN